MKLKQGKIWNSVGNDVCTVKMWLIISMLMKIILEDEINATFCFTLVLGN